MALALPDSNAMEGIDFLRSGLRPYVESFLNTSSGTIDCPKLIQHWANVSIAQKDMASHDFEFLTQLALTKHMSIPVHNVLALACVNALREQAVSYPLAQKAILKRIVRDVEEGHINEQHIEHLLDGVSAGLREGIHHLAIKLALDVATVLLERMVQPTPEIALRIYDQLGEMNFSDVSLELAQSMRQVQSDFINKALEWFDRNLQEGSVAPVKHCRTMLQFIEKGLQCGHATDQETIYSALGRLSRVIAPDSHLTLSNVVLARQILSDAIREGRITLTPRINGVLAANLLYAMSPSATPEWNQELLADARQLVLAGVPRNFAGGEILINLAALLRKKEVDDADSRRMVAEMMEPLYHDNIPKPDKKDFLKLIKPVAIPFIEWETIAQIQRVITRVEKSL